MDGNGQRLLGLVPHRQISINSSKNGPLLKSLFLYNFWQSIFSSCSFTTHLIHLLVMVHLKKKNSLIFSEIFRRKFTFFLTDISKILLRKSDRTTTIQQTDACCIAQLKLHQLASCIQFNVIIQKYKCTDTEPTNAGIGCFRRNKSSHAHTHIACLVFIQIRPAVRSNVAQQRAITVCVCVRAGERERARARECANG